LVLGRGGRPNDLCASPALTTCAAAATAATPPPTPDPRNRRNLAHSAHAGLDQLLLLAGSTTHTMLDGRASCDRDGTLAGRAWRVLAGPAAVTISNPQQPVTTVTGLMAGDCEFELAVTDNRGAVARDTVRDTVRVTVQAQPNLAPVADAGPDRQLSLAGAASAQTVLDGSASHDPEGALAALAWGRLSGPTPAPVVVSPGNAQTVVMGLAAGLHVFELRVTDNRGASAIDTVAVTVLASPTPGEGPLARAGRDQLLDRPLHAATLDGNASSATSGVLVAWLWETDRRPGRGLRQRPRQPPPEPDTAGARHQALPPDRHRREGPQRGRRSQRHGRATAGARLSPALQRSERTSSGIGGVELQRVGSLLRCGDPAPDAGPRLQARVGQRAHELHQARRVLG